MIISIAIRREAHALGVNAKGNDVWVNLTEDIASVNAYTEIDTKVWLWLKYIATFDEWKKDAMDKQTTSMVSYKKAINE